MILSEEDREHFLKLVCPEYRSLAEDLIDGKIDALYIEYSYVGAKPNTYSDFLSRKNHGVLNQAYIEIFEDNPDDVSRVIMLNVAWKSDDIHIIHQLIYKYGNEWEYGLLAKSDTDEKLRWELLKVYANNSECSFILKKKFKKIYDELSDSDKLLLEVADAAEIEWYK